MRWTLSVPGGIAELDTTADGGLAMFGTDGLLQVVGLSSGRPRWGRPAGFPSLPAAAGMQSAMAVTTGMVILGMNGHLTGYDDRTGRVRWTEALRPAQLATGVGELGLLASASLVYLTGVQQRTVEQWTPVLLGISAADGHVHWQLTGRPSQSLSAYGPGLVEMTSNVGGAWQYALDPATGKVRWRAATSYRAAVTPRRHRHRSQPPRERRAQHARPAVWADSLDGHACSSTPPPSHTAARSTWPY